MTARSDPFSHLILAPSQQAANNYLALHRHSFSNPERLWFFCYSNLPTHSLITPLTSSCHKKKIILIHENDLLGNVAAIKIACWLKRRTVQITYEISEKICIRYKGKLYYFPEHKLTLSRFEKYAGFRSQIKTYKIPNS